MSEDYKNSVFLPKTSFPMKAGLSKREPEILAYWNEIDLYQRLRDQSKGRKKFILHFGPPYANGNIHIGHALTYSLKDIVNKCYQMLRYDAPMIPGWDCHGLPIEWKIEESYRAAGIDKESINPIEFREECRTFAAKWMDVQREEIKRLGIVANWKNPYSTMTFATEAKIVEQLGIFLLNGGLYRGFKPVLWSVVEKTALADAEAEYKDHTSDSVHVAFPIVQSTLPALQGASAVIWTTTPWTLPGNRAIAYNPDLDYVIIGCDHIERPLLLAEALLPAFVAALEIKDCTIKAQLKGSELAGVICAHPLRGRGYDFDVPLLPGDHVTAEAGTGLVHTAPGHGLEDFDVGLKFKLEVPETVADDGRYYDHIPLFAGIHVYKANAPVMEALKEVHCLLKAAKIVHSYPHSWRSKAPLIYRATAQWFISMDTNNLRDKALAAIDAVDWFPKQGQRRIRSMVEQRPDWCLSRQRAWGTPLTVFIHKKTGEVLRDAAVHQRIVDAVAQQGGDVWYVKDNAFFLGEAYAADDYEKITDVLDVWFDSGCSHQFVLASREEQAWPADLYLEGSDQHRGWFQASLLESSGTTGIAPYKQVLTHGFVLDEKGYKMSKSLGNVVAPSSVIESMGADLLRLWIISADYTEDMRIGPDILKHQEDLYRRLRNTIRYLLGALDGYTAEETLPVEKMPSLERWVLHRLSEMDKALKESIKNYNLMEFYIQLHTFCAVDLSAFYFDIRKDCLYCDAPDSEKRRAARTVMDHIFLCLTHWLAPVLSFTAEEAWMTRFQKEKGSIHEQLFPEAPEIWTQPELAAKWQFIRDVRRVVTGALEVERAAKTIGSSLQGDVAVYVTGEILEAFQGIDLAELFITSSAEMIVATPPAGAFTIEDVVEVGVVVNSAEGRKCCRCWKILPEVGESTLHPELCVRCETVVENRCC